MIDKRRLERIKTEPKSVTPADIKALVNAVEWQRAEIDILTAQLIDARQDLDECRNDLANVQCPQCADSIPLLRPNKITDAGILERWMTKNNADLFERWEFEASEHTDLWDWLKHQHASKFSQFEEWYWRLGICFWRA